MRIEKLAQRAGHSVAKNANWLAPVVMLIAAVMILAARPRYHARCEKVIVQFEGGPRWQWRPAGASCVKCHGSRPEIPAEYAAGSDLSGTIK